MARYYAPYSKWLVQVSEFLINKVSFSAAIPAKYVMDVIKFAEDGAYGMQISLRDLCFPYGQNTVDQSLPMIWSPSVTMKDHVREDITLGIPNAAEAINLTYDDFSVLYDSTLVTYDGDSLITVAQGPRFPLRFEDIFATQIQFSATMPREYYQPIVSITDNIDMSIKIEGPTWDEHSKMGRTTVL